MNPSSNQAIEWQRARITGKIAKRFEKYQNIPLKSGVTDKSGVFGAKVRFASTGKWLLADE
jgi:hypothetical protein